MSSSLWIKHWCFIPSRKDKKPKLSCFAFQWYTSQVVAFEIILSLCPLTIIAVSNPRAPYPAASHSSAFPPLLFSKAKLSGFLSQENQPQFKSIESFLWEKNFLIEKSVVYFQHPCPALSLLVSGSLIVLHQHGAPGNHLYNILLPISPTSSGLFPIVPFLNLPCHPK